MKNNVSTLRKTVTPPDSIAIWSVTVTLLHLPFTALLRKMNRFPDAIIYCGEEAGGKHSCPKEGKELEQLFYAKESV